MAKHRLGMARTGPDTDRYLQDIPRLRKFCLDTNILRSIMYMCFARKPVHQEKHVKAST